MEEPRRLGGRYELGSVLGRGGMAEVYLAHDTRLGRTVAVKTLRVDLARDPSFQARFRREAQSAASLNHPAIVAVYDTGEDMVYDGAAAGQGGVSIPYIVMEYVDGSTLRELLHSGRKLLPERAMEMCVGILQALEYSHRSGIVHRDIKPANVMLTRTGQVKVMDFGIARAMGDSGVTMTQTSSVIGTAQYLSPEQAKGETVDSRSDLYSTGCLIYELLTNRPPFVGDSPVAVAYQHVREEPQPPSAFDAEITPEMDAIVLRALVKDPDYRYQTADEMRADIEACLDGQPVSASSAMGAGGFAYPDDQPTTAMRAQNGGQTSMLPPVDGRDDGGFYGDPNGRPRRSALSMSLLALAGVLVLVGAVLIGKQLMDGKDDSVTVPTNLVGGTYEDAKIAAKNNNFKVTKHGSKYCKEQKDTVCSTSPREGATIPSGSTVKLVMSKGPAPVTVPDVRDSAYPDAAQQLKAKGFKVAKTFRESDADPGTVLDQKPGGNSQAQKGSTVTLTVAKKATKAVPKVTDLKFDEAKKKLEDAGFQVARKDKDDKSKPADTVVAQDPPADSRKPAGTQVTLTVAKGDDQATVPDVHDKLVADAKKELEGAGFTVGDVQGGGDDNNTTVISTTPPAGTVGKKGDKVTIIARPGKPGDNGGGDQGGGDQGGGPGWPFGGALGRDD